VTYYAADVQLVDGVTLQTALADGNRDNTSGIAAEAGAALAINADYFAARDDGIIIRDGVVYRDVPVRTGLAIYSDGRVELYDETGTSAEALLADCVTDTLSFGPALLVDGELGKNLDTVEVETNPRHPIQGSQPRAGIGIVDTGHFVFVVVDGRSPGYSRGVTLTEFAEIFADLGCTTAYNLDGGGSATLVFRGEVVNSPLGRSTERAVGDILYVA
jgi:exopolysaccharide biosynthesis protein